MEMKRVRFLVALAAGAVGMGVRDRLRLFPYGEIVGATTMIVSTLVYLVMR